MKQQGFHPAKQRGNALKMKYCTIAASFGKLSYSSLVSGSTRENENCFVSFGVVVRFKNLTLCLIFQKGLQVNLDDYHQKSLHLSLCNGDK